MVFDIEKVFDTAFTKL